MSKIKNISGFPEWLPEEKLLEDRIIAQIKRVYESFGFCPIETPAVELKSTLSSKGVIDKEIYLLRRALKDPQETDTEELALHFDLTVPFARYTAQHLNNLVFPFKRYQLQKVWRGERPQKGRFREFYQFDIDIVARDTLPLAADAEIINAIHLVFATIDIGAYRIRINNRKVLLGLYQSLSLSPEQQRETIRIVDKLDKIGEDGIRKELSALLPNHSDAIDTIISYTKVRVAPTEVAQALNQFNCSDPLFIEGRTELETLFSLLPQDSVQFDLSLARGLDYYTGTIFEVSLPAYPEFGTVSSGGRYDDLAGQFTNQKLPGVGGSVGLSRLMGLILDKGLIAKGRPSPTDILITVFDEGQRVELQAIASTLRTRNYAVEIYPAAPKLGKQIEYADKKGIPYVFFKTVDTGEVRVKTLATKTEASFATLGEFFEAFPSK